MILNLSRTFTLFDTQFTTSQNTLWLYTPTPYKFYKYENKYKEEQETSHLIHKDYNSSYSTLNQSKSLSNLAILKILLIYLVIWSLSI